MEAFVRTIKEQTIHPFSWYGTMVVTCMAKTYPIPQMAAFEQNLRYWKADLKRPQLGGRAYCIG